MREQDLRLLKQLIQIGDSIRKLSRSHDRHGRKRNSHRSTQEFMTSAADLSVTLRRFKGRSGSLLGGEYNTVPLVRRQSEPQVCTLGANCDITSDVRSWSSRRGSASSTDWWSEGKFFFPNRSHILLSSRSVAILKYHTRDSVYF